MSNNKLALSLFLMRVGIFIVLFIWAIDKFINPGHASYVWANFYFVKGLEAPIIYAIGTIQMAIIFGFVLGVKKKITTGLVFLMHLGSTVLSYNQYFNPWDGPNILFFAAIPMLAACYAVYSLRNSDTMFSLNIR